MANPNHYGAGAPGGKGGQFAPSDTPDSEAVETKDPAAASETKKAKKAPVRKKKVELVEKQEGGFNALFAALQDLNSSAQVGLLNSVDEIEENIEKLFPKRAIEHIDRLYGNGTGASFQFSPKANPNVHLNIFTCVLGKYRYQDNHAKIISRAEYEGLKASGKYDIVYRGISSRGERKLNILKGYTTSDVNNLDIYGNGVYGTNIYTTTDKSYALGYAGRSEEGLFYGLVDRNAKYIHSSKLENMQRTYFSRNYDYNLGKYVYSTEQDSLKNKLKQHFMNNGLAEDRATRISDSFMQSLGGDISLLAILLGYDYQISGTHQRNILNLKKWLIRGDK